MNATTRQSRNCLPASVPNSDYQTEEYKEVYQLTGAAGQFQKIQSAFVDAGFSILKAELSPHRPVAVVVLRLDGRAVPRFSHEPEFRDHILQILNGVPIWFNEADVTIERSGDRILVAFLWEPPEPGSFEAMGVDQLLALLP